jgi:hypothetical protein
MKSGKDKEQMMKKIIDNGKLIKIKREKEFISKSFKRRNIENNLLGINYLHFPNSQGTYHSHMAKIECTWHIIDNQDWTINDLKEMEHRQSETYHFTHKAGIFDSLTRNFAKKLQVFKNVYRQEEEIAKVLQIAEFM